MKRVLRLLHFFILSSLFVTIALPASAGVEPSPFHEVLNKINAVMNNLESIDYRLYLTLAEFQNYDGKGNLTGIDHRLAAIGGQLCGCNDRLNDALADLSYEEKQSEEISLAISDVESKTNTIMDRIKVAYENPEILLLGAERIKINGEIFLDAIGKHIYNPDPDCIPRVAIDSNMKSTEVSTQPGIIRDRDGYLCNFGDWDEEVAKILAIEEGVDELTDEHWKVVNYLRDYYQKFGVAPMIRKLCKQTGFKLKKIYELFPSGPAKGACKVAGLPKPTGCV